jgi:small multidrug resistance pump
MAYLLLAIAIVSEVIGTTALKASDGFTQAVPSLIVVACYGASFYFLALVLQSMSVSIAYAVWAGLGIVLLTVVGAITYRQIPDLPALLGMGLIVSGVVVIHLYSKSAMH